MKNSGILISFFVALILFVVVTGLVDKHKENKEYILQLKMEHKSHEEKLKELINKYSKLQVSFEELKKDKVKENKIKDIIFQRVQNRKYQRYHHYILKDRDLSEIAESVSLYSEKYDVSKKLILAVIERESAFNSLAVSHAGAKGLMQLMPMTARECAEEVGIEYYDGIEFNVEKNIMLGTWYLKKLKKLFKDNINDVVPAYNAGPTYVRKYKSREYKNLPKETKEYSKYVLKYYLYYENFEF